MAGFILQEILEATAGRVLIKGSDFFTGVSIDSRTIKDNELFIALRGARFDGHDFLGEALRRGAGAIVNFPPSAPLKGKTLIYVENTLNALHGIARQKRERRKVNVIGITGTNGKTTTKEMICSIMRNHHRVLCSSGNLNNQIGLPLNLLNLEDEEFCVLEMGASKKGDIRELCEVALPDYGVITNIGPGHLEGFGSLETVRDTKLELVEYVSGFVFNGDDRVLAERARLLIADMDKTFKTFAIETQANIMAENIHIPENREGRMSRLAFDLCVEGETPITVHMHVLGRFNVYNALAASAMASMLKVPIEMIKNGLEDFAGVPMRLEIREKNGVVVISDVYNANPASMEEAIKELMRIKGRRAVAILGDMLELGSYAEEAHKKLGAWLSDLPVDIFVGVGPLMALAVSEFLSSLKQGNQSAHTVGDAESAKKIMHEIIQDGDTVLIKGSRGMNMEHILEENCAV